MIGNKTAVRRSTSTTRCAVPPMVAKLRRRIVRSSSWPCRRRPSCRPAHIYRLVITSYGRWGLRSSVNHASGHNPPVKAHQPSFRSLIPKVGACISGRKHVLEWIGACAATRDTCRQPDSDERRFSGDKREGRAPHQMEVGQLPLSAGALLHSRLGSCGVARNTKRQLCLEFSSLAADVPTQKRTDTGRSAPWLLTLCTWRSRNVWNVFSVTTCSPTRSMRFFPCAVQTRE